MQVDVIEADGFEKGGGGLGSQRSGWVLFLVCSAAFMLMLDATVVSAALANIRNTLNTSIDGLQWVVDAYVLPLGGVLLTLAAIGDRYGRKRIYATGIVIFTLSSLALALSGSILELDILRAVQGFGGAMLFATAMPLLADAFEEPIARARAIGIFGAVIASATAAGPVVGGGLVTAFGWRSIFTINVPIGIIITAIALLRLPESRHTVERRTDWAGAVLLTGGLVAGVYCLIRGNSLGWSSGQIITVGMASILLLVIFVLWQLRTKNPMFEVEVLTKRGFAGTGIVTVANMATLMAATNYLALFIVNVMGFTPLHMGLCVLPLSIAAFIAAPVAVLSVKRMPPTLVLSISMGMVALALWLMNDFQRGDSWSYFLPGMIIGGAGLGAISSVSQALALGFASERSIGTTSATFSTFRQVGMAMGVAGMGAMFSHVARGESNSRLHALGEQTAQVLPSELINQSTNAIGAGAGGTVVDMLPDRLRPLAPSIRDASNVASISGLNATMTLGAAIATAALGLSVLVFLLEAVWARRRS